MVRLFSRIKRILLGVVGLLLIAALAGVLYQRLASRGDLDATPPPGRLVDVGGHRLHIWCSGSAAPGTPSVLFDSGLGGGAFSWARIAPEVAKFTQTCTYDRAGMGYSDPGPAPRTSGQIAKELAELIQNSGIARPVILAGLSFGGFNTRIVASEHPDLAAGLVLVSASHENQGERSAAAGGDFTITGYFVSRRMGSWWARGAVFPAPRGPASYEYRCPRGLRQSARAGRPLRAERHNPQSIATLRRQISRHLLPQLDACLFCGAPFL